jgi:lysozyme family protein
MDLSFAALESGISEQVSAAKLTKPAAAKQIAVNLLKNKTRFVEVQQATGVPALWLMPVFYRESPSFSAYFGNGDPLDKPTTDVPKGRGPFTSWEAGAIDALELDHISQVEDWSWSRMAYQWELWNGFGPRLHARSSGYVWSWTDQYHGGKYIHDGPSGWSPGTWDVQAGCFAIAKSIVQSDPTLELGALVS